MKMWISINMEILLASKLKYFLINLSFTHTVKSFFTRLFKIIMIFLDRIIVTLHSDIKFIAIGPSKAKLLALRFPLPQNEMCFF